MAFFFSYLCLKWSTSFSNNSQEVINRCGNIFRCKKGKKEKERKSNVSLKKKINWRLTTLQYCSGFFHILTWISHGCTRIPHLEPLLPTASLSHPSVSPQCTSPEHPVSCIEPGLVICFTYDTIHVSMLFSQIIPPFPSPTESKRLFYTSVSLLLSHI